MQGFNYTETVFYSSTFIMGSLACMFRIWKDRERTYSFRAVFGRCATSGIYGFGAVAIFLPMLSSLIGNSISCYACLAISAFVGMAAPEIQEKIVIATFVKLGWLKDEAN